MREGAVQIEIYAGADAAALVEQLCDLLVDAVHQGALVGHVLPVDRVAVERYWRDAVQSAVAGDRVLILAMAEAAVVGVVQLYLSPEPNAPHRGEVFKLLVHSARRRQGIGAALMGEVERQARAHRRSLLLLDTVQGGAGERLYRRLGWRHVGVVPNHFVDPWGRPAASVYMMRLLDSG
jgi:ribosomal protein S18 acetylase RimI-like enzyme